MRFSGAAAIAVLVSAVAAAAPVADPPPVSMDVIVTDSADRPIRDLKISDFDVSDAGQDRPVDAVALRSSRDSRLIGIFLDEYHVQAGESTVRTRAALLKFVDEELRPTDQVAIMKPLDPLNSIQLLTVGQDRTALQAEIAAFTGRKGDYTPTTAFERDFMSRASAPADISRAQIVSAALQALAIRVGAVRDGRKTLILVSEGFSPSLPRGSDRQMGSMRAIVYAANRYDVAIYPVDPSASISPTPQESARATLTALADQTGGAVAFDESDPAPALARAAADEDEYYVVTYRAASSADGKFHPVQLQVKRASAQVRVRSGYWSASAELVKLATGVFAPPPSAVPFRPPHASTLIRPWVGTARAADGLTNVTVAWDPGQAPPRNQRVGSVELKATSDDGKVLFDAPLRSSATFTAAPGLVYLDMTILGIDGKRLDTDYRGIQVPNLRVTRLTFATLEVMRTRNARQFMDDSEDASASPAPAREFSRAERLLLRVPVYSASGAAPTVTAKLLNRVGTPMRTLNPVSSKLPPEIMQFDLPLSSLAPDDYQVEIEATVGVEEVKALLLFRVTN